MWEFINLGSFVMQLINIGLIIYVLNRFLFKPYLAFIKEEDKKRTEMEYAYKNIDMLKEDAKKDAETIIKYANIEAKNIRAGMEVQAAKEREKILNDATLEWKEIIEYAKEETEKMKISMLQSIKMNVLDLALKLNSKVFWKEVVNKNFLERELELLDK